MSEIVKKTGINRKAWNQRFSRLKRKNAVTNDNSDIDKGGRRNNATTDNGDKCDTFGLVSQNSGNNTEKQIKANKFLRVLAVVGFMLILYLTYTELKKRKFYKASQNC